MCCLTISKTFILHENAMFRSLIVSLETITTESTFKPASLLTHAPSISYDL